YPWCRKGSEAAAGPLFQRALDALKQRGAPQAYAAYRGDWTEIGPFFEKQGFRLAREMINYAMELSEMPTRMERPGAVAALKREDVPALAELSKGILRVTDPEQLERYLFQNPYFTPESLFAIRQRKQGNL